MRTEQDQLHTLVRQYKGKHAAEHFQRHAAYMAKRGWMVVGPVRQHEWGLVVTYSRRPLLDPSSCTDTGSGAERDGLQVGRGTPGADACPISAEDLPVTGT